MSTNGHLGGPVHAEGLAALGSDELPIGKPLSWPVIDSDATLLLNTGTVLYAEAQRDFLFSHFQPHRGDKTGQGNKSPNTLSGGVKLEDMHLSIGTLLGMRGRIGMGGAMHASRIIGVSPGRALFVTPPMAGRQPLGIMPGENVEIVAIATQTVFWFVCTVEAVCAHPFDYLILSEPSNIRRLRERKAVRVRTRLAVRHGADLTGCALDRMGIGGDLSVFGMSLAASAPLGRIGERLRVAFYITTQSLDAEFQSVAIIRNVQTSATPDSLCKHGLEFEGVGADQQIALKTFVFDKQDAISAMN